LVSVRVVRFVIAKAGLYDGKPDGKFGAATRKAVEIIQRQKELEVTGVPDQGTLLRLFRPHG